MTIFRQGNINYFKNNRIFIGDFSHYLYSIYIKHLYNHLDYQKEHLRALIQKYLNGTATPEEQAAAEQYYALFENEEGVINSMNDSEINNLESKILQKIASDIQTPKTHFNRQIVYRLSAIAAIVAGLAFFLLFYLKEDNKPLEIADKSYFTDQIAYNRFLQLPDGTTVILHGKSSLSYGDDFNKTQREVILTGEAYFDVKRNPKLPFIIHTGEVKTTVLGTAFNIKAWPTQNDITVSVTRGKVKVEKENKFVAVLTENKQIVYNIDSGDADQHKIDADSSIAWVQSDMTFDQMSFASLAKHLEKRYNLQIHFQNEALSHCTFTGRFSGTESALEVLNILSLTSNTTFSISGNQVNISGEKCN